MRPIRFEYEPTPRARTFVGYEVTSDDIELHTETTTDEKGNRWTAQFYRHKDIPADPTDAETTEPTDAES